MSVWDSIHSYISQQDLGKWAEISHLLIDGLGQQWDMGLFDKDQAKFLNKILSSLAPLEEFFFNFFSSWMLLVKRFLDGS